MEFGVCKQLCLPRTQRVSPSTGAMAFAMSGGENASQSWTVRGAILCCLRDVVGRLGLIDEARASCACWIQELSMTRKNYNIEFLFKALADRTRLRLIALIDGSEVCVCFFVAILKVSQPKISRHLAYMRRAGIVSARREGNLMTYRRLEPPDRAT